MCRFLLDPRTERAAWTILVILGVIGLAYAVGGVLLLIALSLCFAYLLSTRIQTGQILERVLQRRGWEWCEIAEIERLARRPA